MIGRPITSSWTLRHLIPNFAHQLVWGPSIWYNWLCDTYPLFKSKRTPHGRKNLIANENDILYNNSLTFTKRLACKEIHHTCPNGKQG